MNSSRITHSLHLGPVKMMLAAPALLLLAFVAPAPADSENDNRAPDLGDCQHLHVPEGNELYFSVFGVGVQIYEWNGESWDFVAPEAMLFADSGDHGLVGMHFGGPTWESLSGSRVVGTVIDRCTPDPDSIDWLLLQKKTTQGPGIFEDVSYLQRLNTVGGIAPTEPGEFPGQMARVPYTADYVFYRAIGE